MTGSARLKFCVGLLLGAVVLGGSMIASPMPVFADPIVMKMGTATVNDQQHEWLKRFKAAVERDSKGQISVAIYPASQLGSIPRMIEETQFGAIQGYAGPPEFFAGIDPRFQVLGAPALFETPQQAQRTFEDPEVNRTFLALGTAKGLEGIGLFYYGDNGINTRRIVRGAADLKGMKIRDYGGDMQQALMRSIGITGIPMPLDQVLPALQQGAIDGTVSVITTSAALKYSDAAKYFAPVNLSTLAVIVVVSKQWFDALPPNLQKIVKDDGRRVSHDMLPFTIDFIKHEADAWVAAGGVIPPISPADVSDIHKLEAGVASEVLGDKPEVKQYYDLVVNASHKYR
jgi:TRAP-type C4-dicarboxylate transport system substrate-binding protein